MRLASKLLARCHIGSVRHGLRDCNDGIAYVEKMISKSKKLVVHMRTFSFLRRIKAPSSFLIRRVGAIASLFFLTIGNAMSRNNSVL